MIKWYRTASQRIFSMRPRLHDVIPSMHIASMRLLRRCVHCVVQVLPLLSCRIMHLPTKAYRLSPPTGLVPRPLLLTRPTKTGTTPIALARLTIFPTNFCDFNVKPVSVRFLIRPRGSIKAVTKFGFNAWSSGFVLVMWNGSWAFAIEAVGPRIGGLAGSERCA